MKAFIIRLAYTTPNPHLRAELLSVLKIADAPGMLSKTDEAAPSGGGGSKRPGGKFIEFMKEVGDKQVRNPDTGNQVKMKSLKGPHGKEVLHREFEKWLKEQKEKEKPKTKSPKPEPVDHKKAFQDAINDMNEIHKSAGRPPNQYFTGNGKKVLDELLQLHKESLDNDSFGHEKATARIKELLPDFKKAVAAAAKEWEEDTKDEEEEPEPDEDGSDDEDSDDEDDGHGKYKNKISFGDFEIHHHHQNLSKESVADMVGMSVLTSGDNKYEMREYDDNTVKITGPHIKNMTRKFDTDDDGKPYIYNDCLVLGDGAPKGLGTKIFANQVAQAKKQGVKYIKCEAFRSPYDSTWVGYKVWPKMGYDGPIPFDYRTDNGREMPAASTADFKENMEPKLKEAGFKEPYQVSHLLSVEGGEEWWDEHGQSFDAKFDLTDGSQSLQVLHEYLKEKAEKAGTTSDAWISKMAAAQDKNPKSDSKNPKSKKDHENIVLDEDDHKALNNVWKRIREQRAHKKTNPKGDKTGSDLRASLIKLAHANPELRSYLLPILTSK